MVERRRACLYNFPINVNLSERANLFEHTFNQYKRVSKHMGYALLPFQLICNITLFKFTHKINGLTAVVVPR